MSNKAIWAGTDYVRALQTGIPEIYIEQHQGKTEGTRRFTFRCVTNTHINNNSRPVKYGFVVDNVRPNFEQEILKSATEKFYLEIIIPHMLREQVDEKYVHKEGEEFLKVEIDVYSEALAKEHDEMTKWFNDKIAEYINRGSVDAHRKGTHLRIERDMTPIYTLSDADAPEKE